MTETFDDIDKIARIQKLVWRKLNETGRTISEIEQERNQKIPSNTNQEEFRDHPIWHNKAEVDTSVATQLGINPDDWGTDKSTNYFYKTVANQISKLRKEQKIIDWNSDTQGIWRLSSNSLQYFLVQVGDFGSNHILNEGFYQHEFWETASRDSDHAKVKAGDRLIVYYSSTAQANQELLKTIYSVTSVTKDNVRFFIEPWMELKGLSLEQIRDAVDKKQLSDTFRKVGQQGFNISKLTKEDYDAILRLDGGVPNIIVDKQTPEIHSMYENSDFSEYERILQNKNQIIFYGPPGTGKTFTANKFSDHLIAKNFTKQNSPSDFFDGKNFFMINGPWKNWHHSLNKNPLIWGTRGADASDIGIYNSLKINDVVFFSNSTKEPGPFTSKVIFGYGSVIRKFEGTEPYWPDELSENKIIYKYRFEIKPEFITTEQSSAIPWWGGLPFTKGFNSIANPENKQKLIEIVRTKWTSSGQNVTSFKKTITFHPSYSYEDFIEGIKPQMKDASIIYGIESGIFKTICEDATKDPTNTYVLLIDEINRGNISKIFGELITLIEKDKREKTRLYLTYSKEPFTVPKNLYIIGTMNTADRSLTQLDVALRRRFGFIELMPNYDIIQASIPSKSDARSISLATLLQNLNAKIREHEGREKQIGHSYFMQNNKPIQQIEDLQFIFKNEIIPLLQDYFYEDYEKIQEVLGSGFVDAKNMEIKSVWTRDKIKAFEDALQPLIKND